MGAAWTAEPIFALSRLLWLSLLLWLGLLLLLLAQALKLLVDLLRGFDSVWRVGLSGVGWG
jgi:hypothetical protein